MTTTVPAVPASVTQVRMEADETLTKRLRSRAKSAFASQGAVLDEALGWVSDNLELLCADESLMQAWIADQQHLSIGGGGVPVPDEALDAAIKNVSKIIAFPKPEPAPPATGGTETPTAAAS